MKPGHYNFDKELRAEIKIVKAQVKMQRTPNAIERTQQLRIIIRQQCLLRKL